MYASSVEDKMQNTNHKFKRGLIITNITMIKNNKKNSLFITEVHIL